jgi:hypothetical protein
MIIWMMLAAGCYGDGLSSCVVVANFQKFKLSSVLTFVSNVLQLIKNIMRYVPEMRNVRS